MGEDECEESAKTTAQDAARHKLVHVRTLSFGERLVPGESEQVAGIVDELVHMCVAAQL